MKFPLKSIYLKIAQSFWCIPAVLALTAIGASVLFNVLDHAFQIEPDGALTWIFANSPDGARAVLTTISGSMITVTGVLLSTMIVVLTLAAQQYGPRLVKNFIEDRPSQFVIGCFAGCFIYSIITLKNIRSGDTAFVPHLSMLAAVVFAVFCIGLMIYFVQHIASTIQVQAIMRRVYGDLNTTIEKLFPEEIAHEESELDQVEKTDVNAAGADYTTTTLCASRSGYAQSISTDALIERATELNFEIEIKVRPGEFVMHDGELAELRHRTPLDKAVKQELAGKFIIGTFPTCEQDAMFPIRQLEEIAIRALSPGINDPHTAIECIDYLASSMKRLVQRPWPSPKRYDVNGTLRMVATPHTFEAMLRQAFQQIHHYGREDITIVNRLLEVLAILAANTGKHQARHDAITRLSDEIKAKSKACLESET